MAKSTSSKQAQQPKNPAAVELGRRGGQRRMAILSRRQRQALARMAIKARWDAARAAA